MNEELIKDIKAGRCILFLGPELDMFRNADATISHNKHYCAKIREELDQQQIAYDPAGADNAYYLTGKLLDGGDNDEKQAEIRDSVYRKAESGLYTELAIMPFNTIINFGFDNMMNLALDRAGYEFQFDFYNYRGSAVESIGVNKDMQLLYNLYGSLAHEPTSVVRTEQEQLEFLRKINSSSSLPTDLLKRMQADGKTTKSYIFLGFDFNEWPYRFLLDSLQVPKSSKTAVSPREQVKHIAILTKDYYSNRFGIKFTEQSPITFIRELIAEYKATMTEHQVAYISYNSADETVLQAFRENLLSHNLTLTRGIEFFDRSQIKAEQNEEEVISEKLEQATVCILLASFKSINDAKVKMEIKHMLEKFKKKEKDILLFPILASNSLWRTAFPELLEYASIVLPINGIVLSTSSRNPDPGEFIEILNIINSKIR